MIRILGVERVVSRLDRIKNRINAFVDSSVSEAGELCWRRARELAPVRTGRLRDSIRISRARRGEAIVEATAPYAGYVEYGTRYMKPRPYMRPAAAEAVEKLREKLREII